MPWSVVAFLITSLLSVTVWLAAQLARLEGKFFKSVSSLRESHAVIDERVKHLPTMDQVVELNAAMVRQTLVLEQNNKMLDQFGRRLELLQSAYENEEGS